MGIPRNSRNFRKLCELHLFIEKCEFHVKPPESNHSCPRLKTAVKRMPFCMVGRPFGCFWGQNGEIQWIPPILAEFHLFWWNLVEIDDFGVFGGGNGAFTRSSSNTQRILGLFRCFSRPDRYFSPNSTYFRWIPVNSPEMVGIWGLGRKIPFWGVTGWKYHQFRFIIAVSNAPAARESTLHPKTPTMLHSG